MANAENASIEYEGGSTHFANDQLTNSGDNKIFTSQAQLWSKRSGRAPEVIPDGLVTGGALTPAALVADDTVDVAALTAKIAGLDVAGSAELNIVITRAATLTNQISSLVVDNAGAITAVAGVEGATFSEVRGDAGGPPYVPVGSVEIGQVRLTVGVGSPAAILPTEIFTLAGVHSEQSAFPAWDESVGDGSIEFFSALALAHTGDTPKAVYATYDDPIFVEARDVTDFVPPETAHSVSSTQIYQNTLGSTSRTLNQGTFTLFSKDNITDPLIGLKGENLWFRFKQDIFKSAHILVQGILGVTRANPADELITAACTISAAEEGQEFAS